MAVIGFALFLKIILGAMYSIGYRCSHGKSQKKILNATNFKTDSKVDRFFSEIQPSMAE